MHLLLSFHTIAFLVYVIPNIYLFIRILNLFIGRKYRFLYVILYFLLVIIYPLSNILPEHPGWPHILSIILNYLLPYYLYLFLSVLLLDIFLLVNRVFKIISPFNMKDPTVRRISLISISTIPAVIVIGGIINFNTIRLSEYNIEVPGRSSELEHLRIAFAADFHLKQETGISFVKRFAEKINKVNPDLMIFGGDIVEGDRDDGNISGYETILRGIHARYGKYAVLGNHEFYSGQNNSDFFSLAGIGVLCDTVVVIENLFSIAGRYDSHLRTRKPVGDLLTSAPDSLPLILVDHRPTDIDLVASTKTDVQLSGHVHNGQMFPINLITRKVYQLSWGHMKKGNTHFFVTSGIRLWGPPVRTTGKSEIMVIDIDFVGPDKH